MRILVAPNAFKGTLSAVEAAHAIEEGIGKIRPEAEVILHPLSDGGDGFLDCLEFFGIGKRFHVEISSPFHKKIACPVLMDGDCAYIESAKCLGFSTILSLNPLLASSIGVGDAINEVINLGAKRIFIGLGGSVTVDLGLGCADSLGVVFENSGGEKIRPEGANSLKEIVNFKHNLFLKDKVQLVGVCDVEVSLNGPEGGISMFAPQKGMSDSDITWVLAEARRFSELVDSKTGKESSKNPGAGSAGGLGWALRAFFNANLVKGFDWFSELTSFKRKLEGADIVITGEGSFDSTSYAGKGTIQIVKTVLGKPSKLVIMCGSCSAAVSSAEILLLEYDAGEDWTNKSDAFQALSRASSDYIKALA